MQLNSTSIEFLNYVEIKCLRLVKPKLNTINIPLSGCYNDIDNKEDLESFPLEQKFQYFDISPSDCVGIENMFIINQKFGKVLLMEHLEIIIIFFNKSLKDLTIKDIKINITNEVSKEVECKQVNIPVPVNDDKIVIPPQKYYSIKYKFLIDTMAKYAIDISLCCNSALYNEIYMMESRNRPVRSNTDKYDIEGRIVNKKVTKKLTFETVLPFIIKDKFNNHQMKKCQIEARITNNSNMNLMIYSVFLYPEKNKNIEIAPLESEKYKNLLIEPSAELNLIFEIHQPEIFLKNKGFYIRVSWGNMFDVTPKIFQKYFQNKLDLYNEWYSLTVLEKPETDIILNQNFKIIFQIETKTSEPIKFSINSSKLNEKLSELISGKDSNSGKESMIGREFEVIDIVEKNFEVRDKGTFCLICKCNILGTVSLPKLVIINVSKNLSKCYDKLLYFNCIKEAQLI